MSRLEFVQLVLLDVEDVCSCGINIVSLAAAILLQCKLGLIQYQLFLRNGESVYFKRRLPCQIHFSSLLSRNHPLKEMICFCEGRFFL